MFAMAPGGLGNETRFCLIFIMSCDVLVLGVSTAAHFMLVPTPDGVTFHVKGRHSAIQ